MYANLPPLVLPDLLPDLQTLRTRTLKAPSETLLEQRHALAADPHTAWTEGNLWYKLDGNQLRAYRIIRAAIDKPYGRFILNWARRTGKTFVLTLIAFEDAIRGSRRRFNIAAVTKESLKQFIWPMIMVMLEDCPTELRPWMDQGGGRIEFRAHVQAKEDASVIQMAGCDDAAAVERLRGPFSHGNVVEEMGTIPDNPGLRYILTSVLNPQLKSTGGWTLGAMTPPRSSGHASATLCLVAESQGTYDYCTTFDCPRYTDQEHRDYMKGDADLLGMTTQEYLETPEFRREWLALIETDPALAVVATWTPERRKAIVRETLDMPLFTDTYVSMDIGFSPDWTALLYARWSYDRQKLYIVGERLIRRMGTPELAKAVAEDEERFFGYVAPQEAKDGKPAVTGKGEPPFYRVADNNNPILLRDLAGIHGLVFTASAKDNLRAAVADVNRWIGVSGDMVFIHPSCKQLCAQLTAATWNQKGTEFTRSAELGHFDLVASLVYLIRAVIPNINRVPRNYGVPKGESYINNEEAPETDALVSLFLPE